jgi:HSP20 family protein
MLYRQLFGLPTWRARGSFSELERMRQQMDRLMETLAPETFAARPAGVFPLINLTEDRDNYHLRAELPGVKAEDLDIQVLRKTISLTGKRTFTEEGQEVRYHRREREAGTFSRMIGLPGDIDPEKVSATLKNGILTVTVAKAEAAKPRQITVA